MLAARLDAGGPAVEEVAAVQRMAGAQETQEAMGWDILAPLLTILVRSALGHLAALDIRLGVVAR
jgi:hypothetical protein